MRIVPPKESDQDPWAVSGYISEHSWEAYYRPRGWRICPTTDIPVDELTVDEVLTEVGDDPDEALAVMIAEKSGHNRTTLTDALSTIISKE